MKSPEAMASGRGVLNLRFNQDQGMCFISCLLLMGSLVILLCSYAIYVLTDQVV